MYKEVINKIKEYDTIIIHRHYRPDGDAIGSQIGLKNAIEETFPDKKVLITGDINKRLLFLGDMDNVDDADYYKALVFILDTSSIDLISDSRYQNGEFLIKIDHHLSSVPYGDLNIVESEEISCAAIIAKIVFNEGLKLNAEGARALFTGIVTDSGRFRYNGVTSNTLAISSKLLEYDFSIAEVYNNLYIEELKNIKLRAQMTLKFKITNNNVAYIKTTQKEVQEYGVDVFSISRGMIGVMAGIKGIDIWANFTEDDNGKILCELRSNKYDVSVIARNFGGGGHKFASGATIQNFKEANLVLDQLDKLMEDNNE